MPKCMCSRSLLPLTFMQMDVSAMDDSGDSAKDLFITQSSFRVEANTQDAEEAANFFGAFDYDPAAPETVQYFDFSNDTDKTYTVRTESQSQEAHKLEEEEKQQQLLANAALQLPDGDDNSSKVNYFLSFRSVF